MRPAEFDIITEGPTLRINGQITDRSAIHIGGYLGEAANAGRAHLKLDFGNVHHFEYIGIVLLASVLRFYAKAFEEITCCGLPQNIANVLRGFGLEKTGCDRIDQHQ